MRLFACLLLCFSIFAEDWTRFRGPNGAGVSAGTGFPVEFGKEKNVTWRAAVRPGKSSPVLDDQHVFVTGFENNKLYTQCFDRKTGKLLWEAAEDRPRDELGNKLNHPAAISPVTDGVNVYSFFKDLGLVSYDDKGKRRWIAPLGPYTVSMGLGASPVIADDTVIIVADQMEDSFIAGFSKANGEMRWKTPREEGESWSTPVVYGGNALTVSRGLFGAHSITSGKRTANLEGLSPAIVASPVLNGATLYLFGYGDDEIPPFSARLVKLDKNGDGLLNQEEVGDDPFLRSIARYGGNRDGSVSKDEWDERRRTVLGHNGVMAIRLEGGSDGKPRPRELWRTKKALNGVIPSPLLYQGVIYVVRNGGILLTLDAATGAILKEARITGALGGYSASPVAADGKVYFASEEGKIAVLRAGREWEVAAVNDLDEPCFATPALSHGQIYVRTDTALYRFEVRSSR
jgi:outer membrane protein assembly factor BamB